MKKKINKDRGGKKGENGGKRKKGEEGGKRKKGEEG